MKRKCIVLSILLLFVGISFSPSTASISEKSYKNSYFTSTTPLYSPHDPIYIIGNDDFTSENGVTGGSGSSSDPYIISGWKINASSQDGITIRNVSVFFAIRNCYVHDGGINNNGIVFINVTNGVINNNIITRNRNGTIFRTQDWPWKENSNKNYIHHNNITNNLRDGIHFEHTMDGHHKYNKIFLNNITRNKRGIYLIMSSENLIYSNYIYSNKKYGVFLFTCTGGGAYNKVYHNDFINNGEETGQAFQTSAYNDWDNGYPSGGNFWSDYKGKDKYSGPNQNIPGSDGIGDVPYEIPGYDYEDYDFYPLMKPYGNWSFHPVAKFTWVPSLPDENETILFNASESIDYDGNITLYEWDWDNDGEFDENHKDYTATYNWSEYGYYPVTLRVTDNDNLADNRTKTIRVGNQPPHEPSNPNPPDGATNVGINPTLRWVCSDPEGDFITFDVYFGILSPPPKVASNITYNYKPGVLNFSTTYYWKIIAWDNYGASTSGPIWSFTTRGNNPPDTPIIEGPALVRPGTYNYTFYSADPESDKVFYWINKSGGDIEWIGPYKSGKKITTPITWYKKGTYMIRVKAKDIFGNESDWGVLEVTVPKSKNIWFQGWLERFPLLLKILDVLRLNSR